MGFFDEILAQVGRAGQQQSGQSASPRTGGGQSGDGQSPLVVALQEILKNCGCENAGTSGGTAQGAGRNTAPAAGAPGAAAQEDVLANGLNNLVRKLQDGGLDQVIKTWISNGQNAPVAPKDLGTALGRDNVRRAADQAGIDQDDLLAQLSRALPQLIDGMTPNGRLPSYEEITEVMRRR